MTGVCHPMAQLHISLERELDFAGVTMEVEKEQEVQEENLEWKSHYHDERLTRRPTWKSRYRIQKIDLTLDSIVATVNTFHNKPSMPPSDRLASF